MQEFVFSATEGPILKLVSPDGLVEKRLTLNNDGTLAPGDYITVQLTVTLDPIAGGASGAMTNQVEGRGEANQTGQPLAAAETGNDAQLDLG